MSWKLRIRTSALKKEQGRARPPVSASERTGAPLLRISHPAAPKRAASPPASPALIFASGDSPHRSPPRGPQGGTPTFFRGRRFRRRRKLSTQTPPTAKPVVEVAPVGPFTDRRLETGLLTNQGPQKTQAIFSAHETKNADKPLRLNGHCCEICRRKAPIFSRRSFVSSPKTCPQTCRISH